jgi:DNA polymerase-3 subunit alpha
LDALPKKAIENLALQEDLILLGTTRAQYFHDDGDGITFYEKRFGMV